MEDGIYYRCNALYISEDDQLILEFLLKTGIKKSLLIYDSLNNTSKIPEIQNIDNWLISKIYVESLISPFSKSGWFLQFWQAGAVTTYVRFCPHIKKNYNYGAFNLIIVSIYHIHRWWHIVSVNYFC
ncbi:aluminum-activated malate transporter [Medicago truncatula]|uniref:Aluminum-activated malate transporter n=1 Tax=Medicago truncatula TaxID=3880 RepID=A0A072TDJ5_MEDTR|nr:aluminum-activated malate transporter [Medicago truncatula]